MEPSTPNVWIGLDDIDSLDGWARRFLRKILADYLVGNRLGRIRDSGVPIAARQPCAPYEYQSGVLCSPRHLNAGPCQADGSPFGTQRAPPL